MHVAVVHDRISGNDAPDAVDVLAQADAVESALTVLGHTSIRLSCALNLADLQRRLEASQAVMVLNLVESIEGKGRLIHLFPSLLDAMGLPYTGAGSEAMLLSSNKLLAKKWMSGAGIPTPPWITTETMSGPWKSAPSVWIVKSIWEHASIGLDENSIVKTTNEADLRNLLKTHSRELSTPMKEQGSTGSAAWSPSRPASSFFAEAFIEGREYNLSVLAGKDGPEVLPPAEIIFEGYTREMPKIVDYRAKWDETAYAYHHTPRNFDFASDDLPLLETLKELALDCWKCFGLAGYARVDFRVDAEGQPWVLEVNANPCLSPDAGFVAALERAGISFETAIERIIEDANHTSHHHIYDGSLPRNRNILDQVQEKGYRQLLEKNAVSFSHDLTENSQTKAYNRNAPKKHMEGITFRSEITEADTIHVRQLVEQTGFFHPYEVDISAELVDERLGKGKVSGYHFIMADYYGRLAGYACFGPIPCTESSFDLYWIAVHPNFQERGLGRQLIRESENKIRKMGGTRIYVDTSSRDQYASTRVFYESCGYQVEAIQKNFYAEGDSRLIYCKKLA